MKRKILFILEWIPYGLKLIVRPYIIACIISIFSAILLRGIMLQIHYPSTDFENPQIFDYFAEASIGIPFVILMYFRIKREIKVRKNKK